MSEDNNTMQCRMRGEGEGRNERYIYGVAMPNDLDYFKAICKQRNSEIKRLKARLALYDKYLGDTMQKTENAELRAEIERLKGGNDGR